MKRIIYIMLLISSICYAQNKYVECGQDNTVRPTPTVVQVDTLFFNGCQSQFLIQDNAILHINYVVGVGEIKRGGKAGAPTINGIDRFEGDNNPMVVLIGCSQNFSNLEIGENISITEMFEDCNN